MPLNSGTKNDKTDMWIFKPILKSTIWGGERIASFKGVVFEKKSIGECWEISAIKGKESVVASGADTGLCISELVSKYGVSLLGKSNYEKYAGEFPLLVKFIDAQKDLSIQVHPDNKLAQKLCGCHGKSEMWYVVEAEKGAKLCNGFSQRLTKDEYAAKVEDGSIANSLHYNNNVSKGDLFYVPAGRVHSIGAGSFLIEIQQTSDITYRIYDFGRLDSDGNPRELHTKYALQALNFDDVPGERINYDSAEDKVVGLLQTPYFTTNRLKLNKEFTRDYSDLDSFKIFIVAEGEAEIDNGKEVRRISQGMTLLIAASDKTIKLKPTVPTTIIETYVD